MEIMKSIKVDEWFEDADIGIDKNEELQYKAYLQNDDGTEIDIGNKMGLNTQDWIEFDENSILYKCQGKQPWNSLY